MPNASAMSLSIDALAELASTARPPITASAIISAAAVAEVRRGLRSAFFAPSSTVGRRRAGPVSASTA